MQHQNPKEIFGRRLEQARRMRGLSLRGLSEAAGDKVRTMPFIDMNAAT